MGKAAGARPYPAQTSFWAGKSCSCPAGLAAGLCREGPNGPRTDRNGMQGIQRTVVFIKAADRLALLYLPWLLRRRYSCEHSRCFCWAEKVGRATRKLRSGRSVVVLLSGAMLKGHLARKLNTTAADVAASLQIDLYPLRRGRAAPFCPIAWS